MRKKFRSSLSIILLVLLLIGATPSRALGAPDVGTANIKLAILNKLSSLSRTMGTAKDDKTLMSYLSNLTCFSMWNDFANSNDSLGLTEGNLEPYFKYLNSSVTVFNSTYGEPVTDGKFQATKIEVFDANSYSGKEQYKTFANEEFGRIVTTTGLQIGVMFDKINKDLSNASDDTTKEEVLKTNSRDILVTYRLMERVSDEYSSVTGIGTENGVTYSRDITSITKYLNDANYKTIIDYAETKVESGILASSGLTFTKGNSAEESFLSSTNLDGEDKLCVNEAYLCCFSASAVYRPFDSVVGSEDFIHSLNSLTKDNKDIVAEYNKLKSKKKPLYRRDISKWNEGKGDAKRITVAEFMKQIEDCSSGVLVTFKGAFKKQEDGDSYGFETGSGLKAYKDTGEAANKDLSKNYTDKKQDPNKAEEKPVNDNTTTSTPVLQDEDPATANKTEGPEIENEGSTYPLLQTMTNQDNMTAPVFSYGEDSGAIPAMNNLLIHNTLIDAKLDKLTDSLTESFLYINAFGDIVLSDDTVVIPAASNAQYYAESTLYNPCTAAFMNSYPKVSNADSTFSVSDRDAEKMIMLTSVKDPGYELGNNPHSVTLKEDVDIAKQLGQDATYPTITADSSVKAQEAIIGDDMKSLAIGQFTDKLMSVEFEMYNDGSEKLRIMKTKLPKFDADGFTGFFKDKASDLHAGATYLVIPDSGAILSHGEKSPLFPLNNSNTVNFEERCEIITKAIHDGITLKTDGSYNLSNGRLDLNYMTDLFQEECKGNSNIAGYVKNTKAEYDSEQEMGKVTKMCHDIAEKILATVGQSSGVIGIKNGYQDYFFSKFINIMDKFLPLIMVVVFLIIVVFYAKKRVSIVAGTFYGFCILTLTFLALKIFPIYVPVLLNGVVDDSSANIGYKSLIMREEQYINPYDQEIGKNSNGDFSLNSSSMNLYHFKESDFGSLAYKFNVSRDTVANGEPIVVDTQSGLFIQGDTLKINLDRFLGSLSIKGGTVSNGMVSNYSLTTTKNFSNVMDYYTPYYLIVDGFTNKLNNFTDVMELPSSQLFYGKGFYKDSFVVSCYVNSDLYLNNADLTKVKNNYDGEVYDKLIALFGDNNIDTIGLKYALNDYVIQNYSTVNKTLWFQTMQRNGYYDENGTPNNDKLAKLITYVNNTTREFLLQNRGQLTYVSDENLIKITSLFALCQLNVSASSFTDVLYPQSLNYEELTLTDALLPVLTKDYNRYVAQQRNIVSYISNDFGIIGLIFFSLDCILSWAISNIMHLSLPLMYFLLLVSIVVKLLLRKSSMVSVLFKGYLKIFSAIFVAYIVYCFATTWSYAFNSSSWCLIVLFLTYSIILTVMSGMLFSLLTNISDFGNTKVTAMIKNMGNKFSNRFGGRFRGRFTRDPESKYEERENNSKRKRFYFDSSEDDYNESKLERVERRRSDYSDDDYEPVKKRRKRRKSSYYSNDDDESFKNRYDNLNL